MACGVLKSRLYPESRRNFTGQAVCQGVDSDAGGVENDRDGKRLTRKASHQMAWRIALTHPMFNQAIACATTEQTQKSYF